MVDRFRLSCHAGCVTVPGAASFLEKDVGAADAGRPVLVRAVAVLREVVRALAVLFVVVGREPLGLRFFLGGPTVDLRTEDRWSDESGALCGRACAGLIGRSAGRHAVRVAARQGSAFAFASAIRTADGVKSVSKKTLISGIVPGRIPTVSGFVFSRDDSRDGDEGDVP